MKYKRQWNQNHLSTGRQETACLYTANLQGTGFRSSHEMLPMHPGAREREKRLNGNIWWEIKQHPFNPQLSHYPCCNYMPSNSKATRCSKPKPGITHLATILGNEHSDSKRRAAFKLDKMKAFLHLFTKSGRIDVNQNINHFLPNRGPQPLGWWAQINF